MKHFADNKRNYNHHGRGGHYQGGRAGGRGGGGKRFQNDYYDNSHRPRSYGGSGNNNPSQIDGPLSTDRSGTTRRPHSFGEPSGEFKPKKSASMIEYKDSPLPNSVQVAKDLVLQAADFSTMVDGESGLSERILGLGGAMADSDDLKEFYDGISEVFAEILSTLPAQISANATLVTILSAHGEVGPLFGGRVLDHLIARLTESSNRGDVLASKMILRSFACLASSGCIAVDGEGSLCALLDIFLDISYSAWGVNGLATEGRAAIYLLAQTLPWAITALLQSSAGSERISRSLPLFARVISEWVSPFSPTGPKAVFLYDATPDDAADESAHISLGPTAGPVSWDTLWEISKCTLDLITKAQSEGVFVAPACMNCLWELAEVASVLSEQTTTRLTIDTAAISQLQALASNRFVFSSASTENSWLRPCFSIFDSCSSPQACEVCLQLTSLEKVLALDFCRDVTYFFSPVIRFNGTRVGTLDTLVTHLVALRKLFPSCESFQYILVEALLTGFVNVPNDPVKHALTSRLLLELCKKEEAVRPVVALGASVLFAMSSDLDWTVWRSLAEWLGFHLVNTKVSWPYWPQWATDLQGYLDDTDDSFSAENVLFLTMALQKATRILQPDIVNEALILPLNTLIPGPVNISCSLFAPIGESAPDVAVERAQELIQLIRLRTEADEVEQWLEALALSGDELTDELLKIKIFLQALFEEGKGALSVFTSLIDRYGEVLRMYTTGSMGTNQAVVEYVNDIFMHSNDRYRFIFSVDYLVRKGIISVDGLASNIASPVQVYGLSSNVWLFQLAQLAVDRSVDMVQASVKLYLSSLSGAAPVRDQAKQGTDEQDDDAVAVIGTCRRDDDEDSGRRGRDVVERTDEDTGTANEGNIHETAKEALKLALSSAGSVYSTLLLSLFSSIVPGAFPGYDASFVTTHHKSAALSLIMYVSRTLHGLHNSFVSFPVETEIDTNFLNTDALKSSFQTLGGSLQAGDDAFAVFFQKAVSQWEGSI